MFSFARIDWRRRANFWDRNIRKFTDPCVNLSLSILSQKIHVSILSQESGTGYTTLQKNAKFATVIPPTSKEGSPKKTLGTKVDPESGTRAASSLVAV